MLGRRQFIAGLAVSGGALAACASQPQVTRSLPAAATPLSRQRLEDSLTGSSYLGCGGGGSLPEARDLIRADLASGHTFSLLDVTALNDQDRVACPYALASLAPMGDEMRQTLDSLPTTYETPVEDAFKALERHLGTPFSGVILGEIGPLSMAEGLSIAARLGVPALDADTVGRATPEINQHSVRVAGLPLTPAAGFTLFGDELILNDLQDPGREETIFRTLSVISRLVGVADAPITGAQAKAPGTLVTGSFTLAANMGEAVRMAKAQGRDPIDAARRAGDGYQLFTGRVASFDWRDEDGFLVGDLHLIGDGAHAGQRMLLDYKNEHLVARRDGEVIATCPDLITVIDRQSADGVNNPDFRVGQEVVVLGFRSDPIWRTEAGLEVFHPRYFGYEADYIPIEQRLA